MIRLLARRVHEHPSVPGGSSEINSPDLAIRSQRGRWAIGGGEVRSTVQDGYRYAGFERASVDAGGDAETQAADDGYAFCEVVPQCTGDFLAVVVGFPLADNRDALLPLDRSEQRWISTPEQRPRRILKVSERLGIGIIVTAGRPAPSGIQFLGKVLAPESVKRAGHREQGRRGALGQRI